MTTIALIKTKSQGDSFVRFSINHVTCTLKNAII